MDRVFRDLPYNKSHYAFGRLGQIKIPLIQLVNVRAYNTEKHGWREFDFQDLQFLLSGINPIIFSSSLTEGLTTTTGTMAGLKSLLLSLFPLLLLYTVATEQGPGNSESSMKSNWLVWT